MLTKEQLSQIQFTNLVTKSHYSIPFGIGKIKDQISAAAKKGHRGIAITDDNGMNGILEAYTLSKDKDFIAKLKKDKFPIILGTKINLTDSLESQDSAIFNISMYATSWQGYKNMTHLTSLSSMPGNGFLNHDDNHIKRISFENLAERSEGLIIGSGDIDGILAQSIIKGTGQEEDLVQIFKEIFADNFFIEIHYHPKSKFWNATAKTYEDQGEDIQKIVNLELIRLAKKYDIKCCIVQNSYMFDKKYDYIQNISIANNKSFKGTNFYFDIPKYMMTIPEMYEYVQKHSPYITDEQFLEFCDNTNIFVDKCKDIYLEFEPALPKIEYHEHPVNIKENYDEFESKYQDTWKKVGLISPDMSEIFKISKVRKDIALETTLKAMIRLGKMRWDNKEYLDRLALEMKVLARNGVLNLLDYFLLLEDVTNFVRDNGYLRGFGRGSGGGSLLTYVMDISDVEPIHYQLLFERFFTQDRIGQQFHELKNYSLKQFSSKTYSGIDNIIVDLEKLKKLFNSDKLKNIDKEFLEKELYFIECNESHIDYYINLHKEFKSNNLKVENENNSTIWYLLDLTDDKPKKFIKHSEPTMPDFDYDTDGRDAIKKYLTEKNGIKHVTLIGTLGSLKTKGAVQGIIKQLKPDMDFSKEVLPLTKKFDVIKPNDEEAIRHALTTAQSEKGRDYSYLGGFNSELAYFLACLESEPSLYEWFDKNHEVKDAVILLLGNAKGTGVHAGGIVVSRKEIMELCPMTWSFEENIWVTQYEMAYVEKAGLIKYDFLGLKTLEDFNLCLRLIKKRHGLDLKLSEIPMTDPEVFKLFALGKTESVFQFNTDLPVSLLKQLNTIDSIADLAIITALLRPGPMKMGMHNQFVKLKNKEIDPTYLHPELEEIWKDTYSLCAYQETVIKTVKKIGLFPPDVSVAVMKALSKKQKDKVAKFEKTFVDNAMAKFGMTKEKAEEIWQYLFAFSEYGFNASHSFAYVCVSYLCMWFKLYYPAEWISAVLSGAKKEDLEILYPKWKDYIVPPSINQSKDIFQINDENKAVMPFSAVNGVGDKAVIELIKCQPYSSFQDFMDRVNTTVVNKGPTLALIFSGIFDEFKPESESVQRWRKTLVIEYFKIKFTKSKASKKDKEEAQIFCKEVVNMNRGQILMKEISLLNFTAFDYYEYYKDKMTDGAKQVFGRSAVRPEDVNNYPTDTYVVVGGMVEDIEFKRNKKGEEWAIVKLSNNGTTISVQIFARQLAEDDKSDSKFIRNLQKYMPVIFRGKVNRWEGRLSVVYSPEMHNNIPGGLLLF